MINVIYKLTCVVTGKSYIGKASDFNNRWKQHLRNSLTGRKHPLYAAIRKYGQESILIEILEENVPAEDLNELECFHIRESRTQYPQGYNLTAGGTGGDTWKNSPEEVLKARKARHADRTPWNKGLTAEVDSRILSGERNGMFGNPKGLSGNSTTFRAGEAHALYGKKQKESTIDKRVQTRRANGNYKGNPRKVINIETGEVYGSVKEAAESTGLNRDQIGHSCRKRGPKYPYRFVEN